MLLYPRKTLLVPLTGATNFEVVRRLLFLPPVMCWIPSPEVAYRSADDGIGKRCDVFQN